jgi:coproporphyrinogen III oxidase
MDKSHISKSFKEIQEYICLSLEEIDGVSFFNIDSWTRKDGGGGRTNTIKDGRFIEKGGVAFSEVFGAVSDQMSRQLKLEGKSFFATGVSVVLHSKAIHHPIIHMNIRYFEMDDERYWFGGGIDLTPIYVHKELAVKFHQKLKLLCDRYDASMYPKFKKEADQYFFLPHRNESRGIGGVFFDHFFQNETMTKKQILSFCLDLGKLFPELYADQISNTIALNGMNKQWQMLRRSRYVEFNLLHDRGTKFGIYSGGRTESILLSMPPTAGWIYDFQLEEGSLEHDTQQVLYHPKEWITGEST